MTGSREGTGPTVREDGESERTGPGGAAADRADDRRTLARGAGVGLVGRSSARGFTMLQNVVLARVLGAELMGVYGLAWSVLQVAANLAPLGFHQGVIRFGASHWGTDGARVRGVVRRCLQFAMVSGGIVGLGLFALSGPLAVVFGMPDLSWILKWFAGAVIALALGRVLAAATRLSQDMRYSVLSEDMMPPIVGLSLFLFFHYAFGWGLLAATAATTTAYGVSLLVSGGFWSRLAPRRAGVDTSAVPEKELLSFAALASFASLFTLQSQRVDRFLVGYFLTDGATGVYIMASQTAVIVALFLSAFNAIVPPMLSHLYWNGELDRAEEIYRVSARWGFYLSLPFFLTAVSAPETLMVGLYGEGFAEGAGPLVVLLSANVFSVSTGSVGFLLTMTGDQRGWFILSLLSLVLNIVLGILWIPPYGLMGAAASSGVALVTLFGLGLLRGYRRLGMWPYDSRWLKGFAAAAVAEAGILATAFLVPGRTILEPVLFLVVSTALLLGTLRVLGFEKEELELFESVRERLGRARGDRR